MIWLFPLIGIFLCSLLVEVAWVAAVRYVNSNRAVQLIAVSMMLQAISYCQTLILVSDHVSLFAGILGAGVGAWIGLKIPDRKCQVRTASAFFCQSSLPSSCDGQEYPRFLT